MNQLQEEIVVHLLEATKSAVEISELKQRLEGFGDTELLKQFGKVIERSNKILDEAGVLFMEAFKYPLQIFDLRIYELPNDQETVYVYDEVDNDWIRAEFSSNRMLSGQHRFVKGLHILGSPNEFARYVRWTRMPILEEK